jgi:hypothetical protein
MKEQLRRLWRALLYDPQVEYQRAKDLLERRLASSESENDEPRKPKLRLWRSNGPEE